MNQSDLAQFPRSLLNALPTTKGNGRGPAYPPASQRYSPLQQNYDRAVNPVTRTAQYVQDWEIDMTTRQNSGAASAPLPSLASDVEVLDVHNSLLSTSDDGEEDEAVQKTLLTTLTVKSLQNLASYPNPNQKNAQKALLRGSRPRSSLVSDQYLANTAEILSQSTFKIHNDPGFYKGGTNQEDRLPRLELPRVDVSHSINTATPGLLAQSKAEVPQHAAFASTLGVGTKPLAAGPPGQRQQARNSIESDISALANTDRYLGEDDELITFAQKTLSQIGLGDISVASESLASVSRAQSAGREGTYSHLFSGSQVLPAASQPVTNFRSVGIPGRNESMCPDIDSFVYTGWQKSDGHGRDWSSAVSQQPPHYKDLAQERLKARKDRINYLWYSGVNEIDKILEEETNKSEHGNSQHGVIGDNRSSGERMKEHSRMEIFDVNSSAISTHSELLMNIASASLSCPRYAQQSKRRITTSEALGRTTGLELNSTF